VTLRQAVPGDAEACAQIVFDAFGGIQDYHQFPRDFPTLEAAAGLIGAWIPHPEIWGVVAEVDGRIVGSNFLDERDPIRGVGPITVDPEGQNAGVGRKLMGAVFDAYLLANGPRRRRERGGYGGAPGRGRRHPGGADLASGSIAIRPLPVVPGDRAPCGEADERDVAR
jgi:GNAT superfamily N-acetyltransferase